jgi:hypothetical protein
MRSELCGIGKREVSLLAKDGEEACQLSLVEVVLACEVGGGVTIESHLMEFCSEAAQSGLALLDSALKVVEGVVIADAPVGGLV